MGSKNSLCRCNCNNDEANQDLVDVSKKLVEKHKNMSQNSYSLGLLEETQSDICVTQSHLSQIKPTFKKIEYLDGSIYQGQAIDNIKHGKGKLTLPGGSIYEGDFFNDLYHGYGILSMSNNTVYKGEFFEGMQCGKGTLFLNYNEYYEGTWKNNMKNGIGKEVYQDQSYYEGGYLDNKKHFKGKFFKSNGAYYEGEFHNNYMNGFVIFLIYFNFYFKGTYVFPDRSIYEGEFLQDCFSGFGMLKNQDTIYRGNFYLNKKNGIGVLLNNTNLELKISEWNNDIQNGLTIVLKNIPKFQSNNPTNKLNMNIGQTKNHFNHLYASNKSHFASNDNNLNNKITNFSKYDSFSGEEFVNKKSYTQDQKNFLEIVKDFYFLNNVNPIDKILAYEYLCNYTSNIENGEILDVDEITSIKKSKKYSDFVLYFKNVFELVEGDFT
jgi:hypothetical protein